MSVVLDRAQESAAASMRLIGHLPEVPFDPDCRRALCGAEIANIPAFGPYDACPVCDELWSQCFPSIPVIG